MAELPYLQYEHCNMKQDPDKIIFRSLNFLIQS